ncbi:helix-turn-helix domain-containing protein [Rhodococcus sp. G-MC3]|uniref:PucR family transcriptional regulator n=1 Tax=Rhodococcus sp. G-MC3 TaxID=3046209 RepID=UPI0024B9DDA5|nr:helix-turn-helix domain-containing protein [Rhodococcus sp. G-MC3]MDJ0394450.1 helix-turn-helix domain-containing protein [Rhodococcus sp. G-MC3]
MRLNTTLANPIGKVLGGERRAPAGLAPNEVDIKLTAALESQCVRVAATSFAVGRLPLASELDGARLAAEKLVHAAVSLRDAQRAVHGAVGAVLERGCSGDEGAGEGIAVVDRAVFMMRVLEVIGNVVSSAYIDYCRRDSGRTRERTAHIVDMVVSGDPKARVVAERNGVELAVEYDVVVVQFVGIAEGSDPIGSRTFDDDIVSAAVGALTSRDVGGELLLALSAHGGTILVPSSDAHAVETCLTALRSNLGVDIFAATSRAHLGEMDGVLAHCRELVELARCLGMEARLYRTGDLALEYQLSRPGPGQSRLRSVIAPLDGYPELVHTLRTFIASEANRRASAKSLYVHPNTVDYRLKRIEQLTGVDPLSSAGLMSLHAALVVDSLARAHGSELGTSAIAEAS